MLTVCTVVVKSLSDYRIIIQYGMQSSRMLLRGEEQYKERITHF